MWIEMMLCQIEETYDRLLLLLHLEVDLSWRHGSTVSHWHTGKLLAVMCGGSRQRHGGRGAAGAWINGGRARGRLEIHAGARRGRRERGDVRSHVCLWASGETGMGIRRCGTAKEGMARTRQLLSLQINSPTSCTPSSGYCS